MPEKEEIGYEPQESGWALIKYAARCAKPVFLKWEKLRILYNVLLFLWVVWKIAPTLPGLFTSPFLMGLMLIGAVIANLLYLAGPVADTYLGWLGFGSFETTALLFFGGVVISLPLIYLYCREMLRMMVP